MVKNNLTTSDDVKIERGRGNVFADLDRPDADTHFLKAELVSSIDDIIRRRKMNQSQAAKLLGLSQPDISRLLRGNFRDFSVDRLLRLLMALGRDVNIVIRKPKKRRPARLTVEAA